MIKLPRLSDKSDILLIAVLLFYTAIIISLTLKVDAQITNILRLQFYGIIFFIVAMCFKKELRPLTIAYRYALIPIIFLALNTIATQTFHFKSNLRSLIFGYTFFISLLMLITHSIQKYGWSKVQSFIQNLTQAIVIIFTLIQASAVYLHIGPVGLSGTTSNPHFLALYCTLSFFIAMYFFITTQSNKKYLFLIISIVLVSLILYTSSRPTWIAITLSLSFIFASISKKKFIQFICVFVALQIALWHFNPFNYATRCADLYQNISTEERVTIWQDTWQLQKKSTATQWIVGHGLDRFYDDFKLVSRIRHVKDYRSPHNSLLDALYISGIIGLGLILYLFYYVVSRFLYFRKVKAYRNFSTLGLVLFAVTIILNGLNFSLFNNSYLYPIILIFICIEVLKSQIQAHSNKKTTVN